MTPNSPLAPASISLTCPHPGCRTGQRLDFPSSSHTIIHSSPNPASAPSITPAIKCARCHHNFTVIRGRAIPTSDEGVPFVHEES